MDSNEIKKLNSYLKTPFFAFATEEEGFPILKNLIRRMDSAIKQKKLKLKSTRLKKAQAQMNDILNSDGISKLHQESKKNFMIMQDLQTSESVSKSKSESQKISNLIKNFQKRKNLISSRHALIVSEYEKTQEKIETSVKDLTKMVKKLTNREIDLVVK